MLNDFLANRYKHKRWLQASFLVLSVASGTGLIYRVNYSNWLVNMQQVGDSYSACNLQVLKDRVSARRWGLFGFILSFNWTWALR
jgi:hypothetical protein